MNMTYNYELTLIYSSNIWKIMRIDDEAAPINVHSHTCGRVRACMCSFSSLYQLPKNKLNVHKKKTNEKTKTTKIVIVVSHTVFVLGMQQPVHFICIHISYTTQYLMASIAQHTHTHTGTYWMSEWTSVCVLWCIKWMNTWACMEAFKLIFNGKRLKWILPWNESL